MINLLPLKLRLWLEQRYVERLTPTGHGERKLGQFSGATVVDHQLWDQVLKAHLTENVTIGDVAGISTVDYAAVASDGRFDQYLAQLAAVDLDKIPPAEELALYINAYNALTVGLIVAHERRGGPALASINEMSTPAAKVQTPLTRARPAESKQPPLRAAGVGRACGASRRRAALPR